MNSFVFKQIVESFPLEIIITDQEGEILYVNAYAKQNRSWREHDCIPHEIMTSCIKLDANFSVPKPCYSKKGKYGETDFMRVVLDCGQLCWIGLGSSALKQCLTAVLMCQQEEKERDMAREIHDHLAQRVFSVFLGLQAIKTHVTEDDMNGFIERLEKELEQTMVEMKQLTKQLRPKLFDTFQLYDLLTERKQDWELFFNVEIDLKCYGRDQLGLSKEVQFQVYRVIEEAVFNAIKHGKATHLFIVCKKKQDQFSFKVEDNGSGFETENLKGQGFGLYHMKERMDLISGTITWESKEGGPTIVEGLLPLDKGE